MADEEYGLKFILDSGETKTFNSLPIKIGRDTGNELLVDDDMVSGVHAEIYYDDVLNDVCIRDLDSTNGLYLNDLPTRKNVLQDGIKIRIGRRSLVFRDTGYIHSG